MEELLLDGDGEKEIETGNLDSKIAVLLGADYLTFHTDKLAFHHPHVGADTQLIEIVDVDIGHGLGQSAQVGHISLRDNSDAGAGERYEATHTFYFTHTPQVGLAHFDECVRGDEWHFYALDTV